MESCEGAASVTEYDPFISENIDLPIWPRSEKQEPELMPDNKADFRIIPTKLNRPAIDSRWIVRPRLLSAFDDALGRKLTLISAPAGYGKTTLAAQWLAHIPHPSAWLSLDEHDSDPDRFLRYVIASIRKIFPQFAPQIEPLLSSPTLPPLEYLTDTLVSDLAEPVKPWVLVLDDYHTIADETVQKIIIRIVQHLPDNLHMVILTRKYPPWPLSLWRVRGWINDIRADDLSFSGEEARSFLNPGPNRDVSDKTVEMIQRRTEGWIAGLQMARLSMVHADNPETFAMNFSGSDRLIVDFLTDEVLSSQHPEIYDFLIVTAMFDRFCASLCDHLLANESETRDSHNLIELLKKENLFLVALDSEGDWYRYHHLFQTLLTRKMKPVLLAERRTRIHRRAGEWFAGRGLIEEAVTHLIAGGDINAAAELIGENLHMTLEQDLSRRTLLRWLKMFPKDAENKHPALPAAHVCYKMYHLDFAGMRPLMDEAENLLHNPVCTIDESMRRILQGYIYVQRSFYLYWQGDVKDALHHARQAINSVPRHHSWAYNMATIYAASSLASIGRREESLQLLSEALSGDCSAGSRNIGIILMARMAIHCYEGNLDAVEEIAGQVLESHKTVPVADFWLNTAYYFLGSVAYERNLMDRAADCFGRVEQMIYRVNTPVYHDCLIGLALVALAGQKTAKAREYADRALSFAIEMNDLYSRQMSDSFHTRLAMLSGKVLTEPALFPSTIDSNKFWLEIPALTRAEYLISQSEFRSALSFIEDALKQAKQHHNTRQMIQFLIVKSVALKCAGRRKHALGVLEKTLGMAEPLGFVRTFVDRGPVMLEMLNELLNSSSVPHYIIRLLSAFGQVVPEQRSASPFSDIATPLKSGQAANLPYDNPLTRRERDVLKMLAKHLTYKEIAENLFVSPETVKSHAARIYRKLRVSGRGQAIDAAKKFGLPSENR
jgi:LuxR family maltose regulon positive regulatory protein